MHCSVCGRFMRLVGSYFTNDHLDSEEPIYRCTTNHPTEAQRRKAKERVEEARKRMGYRRIEEVRSMFGSFLGKTQDERS